jgi:O-antigen/teichoic acid export membrane protein
MRQRLRDWLNGWKRDLGQVRKPGSFARNALYTFSDAAVNILSQIILTPIVAHIYGPAAYGIYGLFTSITSTLAGLGNLGYTAAFVLPREERKFLALVRAAFSILLGVTLVSAIVCSVPALLYTLVPSWSVMGWMCVLIPWMTLILGATQMMAAWTMRAKNFSFFAKVGPATNVSLRLTNLGTGLLTKGAPWCLIVGDTFIRTLAALWYVVQLRSSGLSKLFRREERAPTLATALEYRQYPLFIFPAQWLTQFALQLPVFGLTVLGNSAAVGQFTLAGSLLLMPLRLFGYSLSSVFIRKATDLGRDDPAALAEFVRRMYVRLRSIGLVPFTGLVFFGDLIFNLVLGEEWTIAGSYCGVMGPFYLFRLLSEPIASVYNALRQEKALFAFGIGIFVLNVITIGIGVWYFRDPVAVVLLFAATNAVAYGYQSAAILHRSGLSWIRPTLVTLLSVCVLALFFAYMRYLLVGTWVPTLR